mmetsp:Transcript_26444/g.86737  ORF Transcript_26444/g.86737 Transcript_26444/m.86737 type:complete len:259 (+) Transcript_26444:381-1157(+)
MRGERRTSPDSGLGSAKAASTLAAPCLASVACVLSWSSRCRSALWPSLPPAPVPGVSLGVKPTMGVKPELVARPGFGTVGDWMCDAASCSSVCCGFCRIAPPPSPSPVPAPAGPPLPPAVGVALMIQLITCWTSHESGVCATPPPPPAPPLPPTPRPPSAPAPERVRTLPGAANSPRLVSPGVMSASCSACSAWGERPALSGMRTLGWSPRGAPVARPPGISTDNLGRFERSEDVPGDVNSSENWDDSAALRRRLREG